MYLCTASVILIRRLLIHFFLWIIVTDVSHNMDAAAMNTKIGIFAIIIERTDNAASDF